jgi:hypothetical protein
MGGSLYPEIRDLPGRMNHRMPPEGTIEEKFALRHAVTFTEGGPFHRLFGATEVMTNTLHGQGIKRPGQRIVIDGHAPDGTPEAVYVDGAPGFTLSVQWHPEYRAAQDPVSRPLFRPSAMRRGRGRRARPCRWPRSPEPGSGPTSVPTRRRRLSVRRREPPARRPCGRGYGSSSRSSKSQ